MSNDFVRWVQLRLTSHGFVVGPVDGIHGALTRQGLEAFQIRHMLPVTGVADTATVKALRAPSSTVTPKEAAVLPDRSLKPASGDVPTIITADRNSPWPRQPQVPRVFGEVGTRQTQVAVPFAFYLAWDKTRRVSRITVHELVAESVSRVFEGIASTYTEGERARIGIDLFGGSLNVRRMRGGNAFSMHSWGIALDFDPERNQLRWGRDRARLAQDDAEEFWRLWEREGWVSLGRARNFDWMHVQAARL